MVNKQAKKINLIVYHDELNSYDFLSQALLTILGWEQSQAENGAHIIQLKGSYVVKTFKITELEKAKVYEQAFNEIEIPVKLII